MLRRRRSDEGVTIVEMSITLLVITVVLSAAVIWLVSAQRVVTTNTYRSVDNSAAESAVASIDSNVRYAQNLVLSQCNTPCSSSHPTYQVLYVTGPSGSCTEWYSSSGNLMEQTSTHDISVIARGVSGLTFAGNPSYNGLISVSFKLNQAPGSTDESAVSIYESFAADNMPTAVGASGTTNQPCSFNA